MAANENTRVIKANQGAKPGIEVSESVVIIAGDSRHFIAVDERGVTIKGPVSFVTDAMGVRRGGLFVGINDFLHMIPSTIITPIPQNIPIPPVAGVANLAKD